MAELEVIIQLGGNNYNVDISHPFDISIPVRFHGQQLSVFQAPHATSQPYEATGFVGRVARGGSCNCDIHTLTPHASGTHTEGVGHIAETLVSIHDMLKDSLIPATLVTLRPEKSEDCSETYSSTLDRADLLLTRKSLEQALNGSQMHFLDSLVVRTWPNPEEKMFRNYDITGAPFFSTDAMTLLGELGIRHLLVDLPSVDRLGDEGRLTNHRIFWNVPEEVHRVEKQTASQRTITELIYVPDAVTDGQYLLNLQLAPFVADAAPSRPILYNVSRI